jgi:hypothetical protein
MPQKGQYKYTKQNFIKAFNSSNSIKEICNKIDLKYTGKSYKIIQSRCEEYNLEFKKLIKKNIVANDYSKEEFIKAVETSTSIAQTLEKLGLSPKGGNYRTFRRNAERIGIDISHFTGQGWRNGKKFNNKRKINEYLTFNGIKISSNALKKRLINEGYLERKCYNCGITDWLGQSAPLELEHINGINEDNRLKNLTLLCPNCHALTPTYRGKNKKLLR